MSFCFWGNLSIFSRHSNHVRRRAVPQRFFLRRRRLTACVVDIVICSVLTHSRSPPLLWIVSIHQFFFPVVCAQLMERLPNLVIVLTSGTCGTAALAAPLEVAEARASRSD